MNTKILTLTIRNAAGDLVGELALEERAAMTGAPAHAPPYAPRPAHVPTHAPHLQDDHAITEAQRRMLFRLTAKLGFEGESARTYVDRRLGPDKDRRSASRLIDELKDELRRNDNGGRDARTS